MGIILSVLITINSQKPQSGRNALIVAEPEKRSNMNMFQHMARMGPEYIAANAISHGVQVPYMPTTLAVIAMDLVIQNTPIKYIKDKP